MSKEENMSTHSFIGSSEIIRSIDFHENHVFHASLCLFNDSVKELEICFWDFKLTEQWVKYDNTFFHLSIETSAT